MTGKYRKLQPGVGMTPKQLHGSGGRRGFQSPSVPLGFVSFEVLSVQNTPPRHSVKVSAKRLTPLIELTKP
jgi:hypothetical protein